MLCKISEMFAQYSENGKRKIWVNVKKGQQNLKSRLKKLRHKEKQFFDISSKKKPAMILAESNSILY